MVHDEKPSLSPSWTPIRSFCLMSPSESVIDSHSELSVSFTHGPTIVPTTTPEMSQSISSPISPSSVSSSPTSSLSDIPISPSQTLPHIQLSVGSSSPRIHPDLPSSPLLSLPQPLDFHQTCSFPTSSVSKSSQCESFSSNDSPTSAALSQTFISPSESDTSFLLFQLDQSERKDLTDEGIDDDGCEIIDLESDAAILVSAASYRPQRSSIQFDHMMHKPRKFFILHDEFTSESTESVPTLDTMRPSLPIFKETFV